MQQMHQGQLPGSPPVSQSVSANASSLDDLLSGAAKDADNAKVKTEAGEKKVRKEKDKNIKLVYSDNGVSPEEKMAQLQRYAFTPAAEQDGSAEGAITAAT